MTGGLTLNGDPTGNLMAATKQYVDNLASNLGESYSTEILSTTATDTGQLTVVSSFSMVKWVIGILTRPQLSVKAFYFYFGAAVRFGFFENRNNNLYYTALDNFHSILLSGDNQIILAEVDTDLLTSGAQVSFAVLGYK